MNSLPFNIHIHTLYNLFSISGYFVWFSLNFTAYGCCDTTYNLTFFLKKETLGVKILWICKHIVYNTPLLFLIFFLISEIVNASAPYFSASAFPLILLFNDSNHSLFFQESILLPFWRHFDWKPLVLHFTLIWSFAVLRTHTRQEMCNGNLWWVYITRYII